jgi:hypothetical protein
MSYALSITQVAAIARRRWAASISGAANIDSFAFAVSTCQATGNPVAVQTAA